MYYVVGGIYTDMTFTKLEEGQILERHGPFETYEEAKEVWRDRASQTLDIATARFIIEGPDERAAQAATAA